MSKRIPQNAAVMEQVRQHGIDPFVRISFVTAATGLSRSTIYRLVTAGKFPLPCHPTVYTTAWRLSDISEWIEQRQLASRNRIRIDK